MDSRLASHLLERESMRLPARILVPFDFSDGSERALQYAVGLAKALGAELVVLHAYEVPVVGMPDVVATAELTTRVVQAADQGLREACAKHAVSGVRLTSQLRAQDPREAIIAVADEMDAGLIVLGTHGRTGLKRLLLGSVAEFIVRTATRPVLTVHRDPKP